MFDMRTFIPRMSVTLGAPAAALGTGTALYHVPVEFWLPVAVVGYCLLIAGCRRLASDWHLAPAHAIVAGLVGGAWTVAGWVGGAVGVLVVAAGSCNDDRRVPDAAWLAGYGL